jgi:hypothetical protein
LINCPTCGHQVSDNLRFCGNCGAEVRAAAPATPPGTPIDDGQTAPYAYAPSTGYGYEQQPFTETPRPVANRMIIVIAVLLLAACCAFACGILIGFEASPILFPSNTPGPTPRVTPTREGLLLIWQFLIA